MARSEVKRIYDVLFSFERGKKGGASYPIHKKLDFSKIKNESQDITDWLIESNWIKEGTRILDAGCGTGYTLLQFCKHLGCTGLGISLSEKEIESCKASAKKMGLENSAEFKTLSFTDVRTSGLDWILAIESLKHAPDLEKAIDNISTCLLPDGRMLILEDFFIEGKAPGHMCERFMDYWSVQKMYTEKDYRSILEKSGMKLIDVHDFTSLVYKKNKKANLLKMAMVEKFQRFMGNDDKRELSRIFNGGLIMDHFYAIGAFEYKMMIVGRKL